MSLPTTASNSGIAAASGSTRSLRAMCRHRCGLLLRQLRARTRFRLGSWTPAINWCRSGRLTWSSHGLHAKIGRSVGRVCGRPESVWSQG